MLKVADRAIQDSGLKEGGNIAVIIGMETCLLYTSPSPRDMRRSRMPSSA